MDDFSADANTTGLFSISGEPVSARHETSGDVDWIRVDGLNQFFFYDVRLFRSTDDDFLSFAELQIFDQDSNLLFDPLGSQRVPSSTGYHHFGDTDIFVSVGNRSNTGGYRLFVGRGDYAGNTFEEASPFAPTSLNQFASALEKNEDVDFLTYRLFSGVEYTFNLLGRESVETHQTDLVRMSLRLYDPEGNLIVEDDQSATFNNASITYTPTETAEFVFEVDSDSVTGSYILESEQFDDYLGNINTEGVLLSDGTAVTGQSNYVFTFDRFDHDEDWFRLETRAGFKYDVEADFSSLSLRDRNGTFVNVDFVRQSSFDNARRRFTFTADENGPYFVAADRRLSAGGGNYSITANVIDDHPANLQLATRFDADNNSTSVGTIDGAFSTVDDRDFIRIELQQYANYRFTINADPELKAALSVRDDEGAVVATGLANQPLRFSYENGIFNSRNSQFFLDARSNASETGRWTLNSEALQGGNDASTQWNVDLSTGRGRIRSVAFGDEQEELWHRFEVTPNTWYEIQSNQTPFEVRLDNANAGVATYRAGTHSYFSGNSSDTDRYIVIDQAAQTSGDRGYEINIVEDAQRRLDSRGFSFPNFSRFNSNIFRFPNAEVRATVPYFYVDGETGTRVAVAANEYQTLNFEQWSTITFGQFNGAGEIYYREVSDNGNSQWSSTELYGYVHPVGVTRARTVNGQIQFAFAEGIPDYLSADDRGFPSEFQTLDEAERNAVRDAIFQWDRVDSTFTFNELDDPGLGNDAAQVTIYKAALDSDVLAFPLLSAAGTGQAGDIILNANSPLLDDLESGSRGFFELLRSVGTVLDVSPLPLVGRDESVLGTALLDDERANLPYPSSLLPLDINRLRQQGSTALHQPSEEGQQFRLSDDTPLYETIIHTGLLDGSSITAVDATLDASIDLRPGHSSFLTRGDTQPATWFLSNFSAIARGTGGSGNDTIRGNHYDENHLVGNAGNDTLIGGVGTDFLNGGSGDDFYSYRLGHGNDFIDEENAGGSETLRIDGLRGFDGIEDLRFRRSGNDLTITLELDGADRNADAIVIRNMGTQASAIERLALLRESNFLHSVSLQSVWTQADNQPQRFDLAAGNDSFGSLVSPSGV